LTTAAIARPVLIDLYDAAIAAAAPGPAVARAVSTLPIERDRRVWIFAFGKAAHPMAAAAIAPLIRSMNSVVGGVIVTGEHLPTPYPTLTVMRGDHPVPGRNSFAASAKIEEVAAGRRGTDVALVLISGGTSSMIGAPLRGMSSADLTVLYEQLLGSGLDIRAVNAVRKRFSRWAAGRLALALAPAATFCFAISDVAGDDLSVIGSGPCVPDETTVRDVSAILQRANLLPRLPQTHRDFLGSVSRGSTPETPRKTHPAFAHVKARVIGNVKSAVEGAAARAREQGIDAEVVRALLVGEAAAAGESIAHRMLAVRADAAHSGDGKSRCVIWGGETTVTLTGPGSIGTARAAGGGRCQELALAAARTLHEVGGVGPEITILAAGTDGRDGATDAAGAVIDGTTWSTIAAGDRDPRASLASHESHGALRVAHALIPRRETGTNVNDIVIGLVR